MLSYAEGQERKNTALVEVKPETCNDFLPMTTLKRRSERMRDLQIKGAGGSKDRREKSKFRGRTGARGAVKPHSGRFICNLQHITRATHAHLTVSVHCSVSVSNQQGKSFIKETTSKNYVLKNGPTW